MENNVLVPIADGSEEIEAVSIIDTLRRAELDVTVARVGGDATGELTVTASRGVVLAADTEMASCEGRIFAAIALPGGMPGAEHLRDDVVLTAMLKDQRKSGRLVAAICASPAVVLAHHDLIGDLRATCYPSLMDRLPAAARSAEKVVRMGNLITSRGPGTALLFALEIVDYLCGPETRADIAAQMLLE